MYCWASFVVQLSWKKKGDQVCQDMLLESKQPGTMPLSGVAPLHNGFVGGSDGRQLEGGQLKRVVLELLECRFLSLVFLECVG